MGQTRQRNIKVIILSLTLFGLIITACKPTVSESPTAVTDIPPVLSKEGVVAEGRVVPAQFADIGFNTSGIVAEVLVKEGDQVKAGDVIARLENSEAVAAEVARAEEALLQAQQAREALDDNLELNKANALKAVAEAYEAMREADRQLYYFTVPANQRNMDMFEAAQVMRERLEKARLAWEPYKYEEDYLWQSNPRRKQLKEELDNAEGDFRTAMLRITYAANLKAAEERLAQAQNDYETLSKGPDPDDVAAADARLKNAQAALAAAQAALDDLELKAPFDGTIASLSIKVGETVTMGKPLVRLVDFTVWKVETDNLTEIEVVQVEEGQKVTVVADALPDQEMEGVVEKISDVYEEKRGDVTYTVKILLNNVPEKLRWGMTVVVTFPTD